MLKLTTFAFEDTTMPFGKWRGHLIEDIPSDYLGWALRGMDHADEELRRQMREELNRRRAAPGTVHYVKRRGIVHLSLDGDLPACGSLYSWAGGERTTYWPGGRTCRRGCFE